MLSDQERMEVLKTARSAAAATKVLLAGTGLESVDETLKLTEYAAEVGYDVAMVRTPHFYRPQMKPANLLAFYRTVADRSPIPVLLYNVTPYSAYDLPAEVVLELAEHSNIIGMKESMGDLEKLRKMVEGTKHITRRVTVTETFEAVTPRMLKTASGDGGESQLVQVSSLSGPSNAPSSSAVSVLSGIKTRQKEVGFQILVGSAEKFHSCLETGVVGGVLGFADPAPTACYEIYAAWKEGDAELARLKQERISDAAIRLAANFGIPGFKYAMDFNGYYGGPSRLPLLPLSAHEKAEVEKMMANIRN